MPDGSLGFLKVIFAQNCSISFMYGSKFIKAMLPDFNFSEKFEFTAQLAAPCQGIFIHMKEIFLEPGKISLGYFL